ncbi:MAG: YARHG domain-containing protein [Oscillospiraceae bacterium]|nr:YARHG domain-containing protein [Oscillospiraceae bacterium]
MWKCEHCQNENKDSYRYCLQCGEPRPDLSAHAVDEEEEAQEPGKRSSFALILLLIASLLMIIAIVAFVMLFQRVHNTDGHSDAVTAGPSDRYQRYSDTQASASPSGGTSSFVFGGSGNSGDGAVQTPIPIPTATPAPSPEPSAEPSVAPSAAPAAGEYLIPESHTRYITDADLKDLTHQQCTLARNEIFARHGRIFSTPEIARYFESKSWYKGTISAANFSENVFNEFEKANVAFIINYEASHWGGSYY